MNIGIGIGIGFGEARPPGGSEAGPTHGPNAPGTVTQFVIAGAAWSNPDNVKVDDANAASSVSSTASDLLVVSNFGFNIGSGKTILGLKAEVLKQENSGASLFDATAYFTKDAENQVGDELADQMNAWPAVAAYTTYGADDSLSGGTWTPEEVNDPGFGFAIAALGAATANILFIRITVTTD